MFDGSLNDLVLSICIRLYSVSAAEKVVSSKDYPNENEEENEAPEEPLHAAQIPRVQEKNGGKQTEYYKEDGNPQRDCFVGDFKHRDV
jgi:hypothetical protein